MATKIRVAVLGTGSLGKEHARIYAEMAAAGKVDFAGVYDANAEVAHKIGDYEEIANASDHCARKFLNRGALRRLERSNIGPDV